jgi:hypothetical protein
MTEPTKSPDEFDAFRVLYETLKGFKKEEQLRLLRWVQEKLDITSTSPSVGSMADPRSEQHPRPGHSPEHSATDIKTFIGQKDPKSDNQFAAAVAYYYRFEAPEKQRKEAITREDLVTASRLINRKRLKNPAQVLVNAHHQGLLDRSADPGHYSINAVGENLVAIVLPAQDGGRPKRAAKQTSKRAIKRKPGK